MHGDAGVRTGRWSPKYFVDNTSGEILPRFAHQGG